MTRGTDGAIRTRYYEEWGEGDLEVNGAIGKASPSPLLFVDVHVEDDLTSLAIYCRPKLGYARQRWL